MEKNSRKAKYIREYEWSNVFTMIRNSKKEPDICREDFTGKLVILTGATSGIGYATAHKFASKGANLLCINRNKEKSELVCAEITDKYKVSCRYKLADLGIIDEVHRVATELAEMNESIDVLIHNAGIYLTRRELTVDGLDKVFMIQYLSSFIINYRLMDKLKSQERARIILVNSEGHRFCAWGLRIDDLNWEKRRYSGLKSYGSAKTAQLLSMLIFDEQFRNSGVTINAMHPGAVKTETGQDNGPVYRWYKKNILNRVLKSVDISAEALYYLAVSKELENVSGKFFNLTTPEVPAPPALDREVAEELWKISIRLGKLNN